MNQSFDIYFGKKLYIISFTDLKIRKKRKSLFGCRSVMFLPSFPPYFLLVVFQDTTSFYTIQNLKVLTQDNWANPERSCLDTLDDVRVSVLDLDHILPQPLTLSLHLFLYLFYYLFSLSFQSLVPRHRCAMTCHPYRPLENDPSTSSRRLDLLSATR